MSHVNRCVPRCSDATSSRCASAVIVPTPSRKQLDRRELRGERRAELVRDVREHRVARAAHGLELGLVAQHLHLQAVGVGGRRARDHDAAARSRPARATTCSTARPAPSRRACTIGHAYSHGRRPLRVALRLQHVAAEHPDRIVRGDLRAGARPADSGTDPALLVDRVHALDDAAEHRLRLRSRRRSSAVRSTRLRRIVSIVLPSIVSSLPPPIGIDVARSPEPSRAAASVSTSTALIQYRPMNTLLAVASAAITIATSSIRPRAGRPAP